MNLVGGDNSGRMIANVEHYHEAAAFQEKQSPFLNPKSNNQIIADHRLDILGLEKYAIEYSYQLKWIRASSGNPAVSLCIENRPANIGEDTSPIKDLVATIRFYRPKGVLKHTISRTYWLGHSENRIRLSSGQTVGILIVQCVGNDLYIYENPRESVYIPPHRPPEWPVDPPTPKILSFLENWDAEIIVIAGNTSVARAVLRLTPTEEGCSVLLYEKFARGDEYKTSN